MRKIATYMPLWAVATLLLVGSCTREGSMPDTDSNALGFRITRSAEGGPTTEAGTSSESKYTTLRIAGFQGTTAVSVYDDVPTIAAGGATESIHYIARNADGSMNTAMQNTLLQAPTTLLAIGNGDMITGATLPTKGEPLQKFRDVVFDGVNAATVFDAATRPVMVALVPNHNFAETSVAQTPMERTCAKLRINVVNKTGDVKYETEKSTIRILNVPDKQSLLPREGAANVGALKSYPAVGPYSKPFSGYRPETDKTGKVWTHHCYVNENKATATAEVVTVEVIVKYAGGDVYKYLLPLNAEIKRNTIYELTVNIYGPGGDATPTVNAEIFLEIEPWAYEQDADIIE